MKYGKSKQPYPRLLIVIGGISIVTVILVINIAIFRNYERNITELQKHHVLTIAKAVADNLESQYEHILSSFRIYCEVAESVDELEAYYHHWDEISFIALLNEDGELLARYGTAYDTFLPGAFTLISEESAPPAGWLSPVQTGPNHFVQFLYCPVVIDKMSCLAVASVETEAIYNQVVRPIKVGESGYSMVKDSLGIILMHSAPEQIGLDAVEGRLEYYADYDLDLSDLKIWVEEQKAGDEGSRILNSYWWSDPDLRPSKKVVAFTKAHVGNDVWIVNSTLDYQEIAEPIRRAQEMVIFSSGIIIVVFLLVIYQAIKNLNIQNAMHIELSHLQEMKRTLEALQKSQELLRHTERISTIGSMTSMIAHEFSNYLTPIRIYGEFLAAGPNTDEQIREYAGEILQAVQSAGELNREISIFGRRDGEQKPSVMPLIEEIQHSISLVHKMLPDDIRLLVDLEGEDLQINALRGTVNQVIINLCTNAIHAMKKSGGTLEIRGRVKDSVRGPAYHISVIDTGIGMTEEILGQIFQPFFTTKESGVGTGLGLAIIKDIIVQLGGTITASSKPGAGSQFDILLPLYQPGYHQEQASASQPDVIIPQPASSIQKLRILILDDQKPVAKAIEKALHHDCQCDLFYHPYMALEAVKDSPAQWDVVLTDYDMPLMSGIEFAERIKQLGVTAPVILMSGQTLDPHEYIEAGEIDGFIEKPVTMEKLRHLSAFGNSFLSSKEVPS